MPSASIHFHFPGTRAPLKSRQQLKGFIRNVFSREKTPLASLDFIFCTDEHLLKINQEFLKHDYYTDIVTFSLSGKNEPITGEIYISIDRVRYNAFNLAQYYYLELHRVIFHGCLHLCGYKDKTQKEVSRMREKENELLNRYFK